MNIVLCDGASLNCRGITVPDNVTLNIFDQKGGTGKLTATASSEDTIAAIGGSSIGKINIHGGDITAESNGDGAGIGGQKDTSNGTINIYGGNVKAINRGEGAGIGGGYNGNQIGDINIYGGEIFALGGEQNKKYGGAGIGGGYRGACGTVDVKKGTVTAFSIYGEMAIGRGYFDYQTSVSIGTLKIYDTAMVIAGDDELYISKVSANARVQSCNSKCYVEISPCDHQGAGLTYHSHGFEGHTVECSYCLLHKDEMLPHHYQQNQNHPLNGWF